MNPLFKALQIHAEASELRPIHHISVIKKSPTNPVRFTAYPAVNKTSLNRRKARFF